MKIWFRWFIEIIIKAAGLGLAAFVLGCTSQVERMMSQGEKHLELKEYILAVAEFEKITKREPASESGLKAAREAARIEFYDLKNFEKAAEFYRLLVFYSTDPDERVRAQKQIVSIYFDQINNYENAISEINKLLPLIKDPTERAEYKMNLARAYYYQNNFFQSLMEVDEFLKTSKIEEKNFQMMILKANILLAQKKQTEAATYMRELMKSNPKLAAKENLGLTLAVVYEEMKDYKTAIEVLKSTRDHHPTPEFIDIRINRLQERIKNQPGARGFRK